MIAIYRIECRVVWEDKVCVLIRTLHRQQSLERAQQSENILSCLFLSSVLIILPDFIKQNPVFFGYYGIPLHSNVAFNAVGYLEHTCRHMKSRHIGFVSGTVEGHQALATVGGKGIA